MKANYIFIVLLLILTSCKSKVSEGFVIDGTLKGAKDGLKVQLLFNDPSYVNNGGSEKIEEIIKDEHFQFSGKIESPGLYTIVIVEPEKKRSEKKGIPVCLENETIKIIANLEDVSTLAEISDFTYDYRETVISGSESQLEFKNFLSEITPINTRINSLWAENAKNWKKKKKLSVDEGIDLANRFDSYKAKKCDVVFSFIKNNLGNEIGRYMVSRFVKYGSVRFTKNQYEELIFNLIESNEKLPRLDSLAVVLNKLNRVSVGSKYVNLTLKNRDEELTQLSDYIEDGKYTLVEFWASWCGPCRADIPHLKNVFELYQQEGFNIVSISVDKKKDDWMKALNEEEMSWAQLINPEGTKGDIKEVYNILGVPACFLIGPDGTIVTDNMRGSYMDKRLIKMYGNKFGDKY